MAPVGGPLTKSERVVTRMWVKAGNPDVYLGVGGGGGVPGSLAVVWVGLEWG